MTTTLLEYPAQTRRTALLALHVAPAALIVGGAVLTVPLIRQPGWPEWFALALSVVLLTVPVSLGALLRGAHRATGRWSLTWDPTLVGRLAAPATLLGAALAVGLHNPGWSQTMYPSWLTAGDTATALAVLVVGGTLLADGLVAPVTEEWHRFGSAAAGVIASRRYREPSALLFVLVVQAVVTYAVVHAGTVTFDLVATWLSSAVTAAVSLFA